MIPSKRIGRLEIKSADAIQAMAEAERKKKAEALEEWRHENHERIRWEMFLRLWGPDSDFYKCKNELENEPGSQEFADMLRRILKHYDGHIVNFEPMSPEERAFAYCLEEFYAYVPHKFLLEWDIEFGIGGDLNLPARMPYDEKVEQIDAKQGTSAWRQICYLGKTQRELDEEFGIESIEEIPS